MVSEPENERVEVGLVDHKSQTLTAATQNGSSMMEDFGDPAPGLLVES